MNIDSTLIHEILASDRPMGVDHTHLQRINASNQYLQLVRPETTIWPARDRLHLLPGAVLPNCMGRERPPEDMAAVLQLHPYPLGQPLDVLHTPS